jgi:hypothetical protein
MHRKKNVSLHDIMYSLLSWLIFTLENRGKLLTKLKKNHEQEMGENIIIRNGITSVFTKKKAYNK